MSVPAETDPTLADDLNRGRQILGIMAKHWTPGEVKTRLGATVGNEVSAGLHRRFLIHLCQQLASIADNREVVVTPAAAIATMAAGLSDRWNFRPQAAGDLGERMRTWFDQVFRIEGYERAVLIGADCPNLKPREIQTSLELLQKHQVVLGPANDGGYYLIALQNPLHHSADHLSTDLLFTDMIWSREDVLEATRKRIDHAGWSLGLLPTKSDVDEIANLQRLRIELQTSRETDPIDGELADEISLLLEGLDMELPH